ncbi:hypothetical protein [Streptomyces sp. MAR4 CNX-425]|uniref:hypothetical protein n=1 Tax=Streptomyces sp. MAR4 CNX-425 TaxID=3406343 RepID=UPI003B513F6B
MTYGLISRGSVRFPAVVGVPGSCAASAAHAQLGLPSSLSGAKHRGHPSDGTGVPLSSMPTIMQATRVLRRMFRFRAPSAESGESPHDLSNPAHTGVAPHTAEALGRACEGTRMDDDRTFGLTAWIITLTIAVLAPLAVALYLLL